MKMDIRRFAVLSSACALALGFCEWSPAAVIVQIVEADGSSTTAGPQYAPVEFAGSSSTTVGGVTYHAMSGTSNTYSSHANTVANRLIGNAGGNSVVDTVYTQYAGDYLADKGGSYVAGGTSGYGLIPLPAATGNDVRVINHSYIAAAGLEHSLRVLRTLEYVTSRDDLVFTSGAVTDSQASLMWGQRNGIAVRGTQGFAPDTTSAWNIRKHADVWAPTTEQASFSAPSVAGIAAQLIHRADTSGQTNGARHEVIKSILMTGADKTATDAYFTSWTRDLPNNLDIHDGAGRVSATNSYSIFDAGEQGFTALPSTVQGTVISSPAVATSSSGWGYISSIGELESVALVFHQPQQITDLTATLAWDVTPRLEVVDETTYIDGGADMLANLDLRVYSVNFDGATYTLGEALDEVGLSSLSTDSNVEHLYFTGVLPAGHYAFVITYADTPDLEDYLTDAGFSYRFTPVPEPSAAAITLGSLAMILSRRRARA